LVSDAPDERRNWEEYILKEESIVRPVLLIGCKVTAVTAKLDNGSTFGDGPVAKLQ
jgi:hypothetical protein